MSDAFSAERLAQLEERWRREPESRIFLQLAEEYRRGGMMSRAVEALEQGVARHPNQVSALVALGRCRLEVDDAPRAVEAFETALTLDPAQLVANRMLVEAYLRTQQPAKARERLATLHGAAGTLDLIAIDQGGTSAKVTFPLKSSPSA